MTPLATDRDIRGVDRYDLASGPIARPPTSALFRPRAVFCVDRFDAKAGLIKASHGRCGLWCAMAIMFLTVLVGLTAAQSPLCLKAHGHPSTDLVVQHEALIPLPPPSPIAPFELFYQGAIHPKMYGITDHMAIEPDWLEVLIEFLKKLWAEHEWGKPVAPARADARAGANATFAQRGGEQLLGAARQAAPVAAVALAGGPSSSTSPPPPSAAPSASKMPPPSSGGSSSAPPSSSAGKKQRVQSNVRGKQQQRTRAWQTQRAISVCSLPSSLLARALSSLRTHPPGLSS